MTPSFSNFKLNGIDNQNNAFAGVGKPINVDDCLVSILNFANRNMASTGKRKAAKGIKR